MDIKGGISILQSVAMGESLTAHIDGDENPADMLTKVICSGKGGI